MAPNPLNSPLSVADPEVATLIQNDVFRDAECLNLLAAETYSTLAVREANCAPIIGLEGGELKIRYAAGQYLLDQGELLCKQRALEAYHLDGAEWEVNVQPLSGALSNLYIYTGLLKQGETILRMELSHGGHLSHGHVINTKAITETAHRFVSIPYHTRPESGLIDYDEIETLALQHHPRIITCGFSAYPRIIDFPRLASIANKVNAYLHCDMSHICGLVALGFHPSPFDYCDVVSTTVYKNMRGPPTAMIICKTPLMKGISRAIFPRFQAGVGIPHILSMAVSLKLLHTPEMKEFHVQFLEAAQILAHNLLEKGYNLISGGTDIHFILIDLRNLGVGSLKVEKVLDMANIVANRNPIASDTGFDWYGIRVATPQMIIRGMKPAQATVIGDFLHRGVQLACKLNDIYRKQHPVDSKNEIKQLEQFAQATEGAPELEEVAKLRAEVIEWVRKYPPPGIREWPPASVG